MKIFMILAPFNHYSNRSLVAENLPYGSGSARTLNIFSNTDKELKPVVLFWHGGSWKAGDKKQYNFVGDFLVSINCVGVIVGHPLFPQQTFPGFIDDANMVVGWVRKNIREYGGDPDRIYLMGHSAGAHTALVTTLKNHESYVKGCISLASPSSVSKQYYKHIFSDKDFALGAQKPTYYLKDADKDKKYLIAHGTSDLIVSVRDGRYLIKEFQKSGINVSGCILPVVGHLRLLSYTSVPLARFFPLKRKIRNFISN